VQQSNAWWLCSLLRARRNRPRYRSAADPYNELAPLHSAPGGNVSSISEA
jgi:hypothetical protein